MPVIPASDAMRQQLLGLGEEYLADKAVPDNVAGSGFPDQRYTTTSDEYLEHGWWHWDAAEVGGSDSAQELKLGMSALAAVLWRLTGREWYRQLAVQSIDTYLTRYFNPATGAPQRMFGTDFQESAMQAAPNLALAVCALGEESRWREQIVEMSSYARRATNLDWWTNANWQVAWACLEWLAVRCSGYSQSRMRDFEWAINFAMYPNTLEPGAWPGHGLRFSSAPTTYDWSDGVGHLTEFQGGGTPGTDKSADHGYDAHYARLGGSFAAVGYVVSGEHRFRRLCNLMANKMAAETAADNSVTYVPGVNDARHVGSTDVQPDLCSVYAVVKRLMGRTTLDFDLDGQINSAGYGIDQWFRSDLGHSNINKYRGAGIELGVQILAAHGVML